MLWNRTCVRCSTQLVIAATLLPFLAAKSAALELSIVESGPESDAELGLRVTGFQDPFPSLAQLVSPSGQVFTRGSILEEDVFSGLLIRFDSLSDAIDYVEGTWQATLAPPFPPRPDPPAADTFEFSIDGIASEALNRTVPTLLAPSPGAVIKNGNTFRFGWDYLTNGEAPGRTRIDTIPQFDPVRGGSRSIVSTPHPEVQSEHRGSGGVGDRRFARRLTSVLGTDQNRFLLTLEAAEAALPLDVEMKLGSHISLDDVVTLGDTSQFRVPPSVTFIYSRERDPFMVTLSTVPEPSSIGLMVVLLIGALLVRSRVADRTGRHY